MQETEFVVVKPGEQEVSMESFTLNLMKRDIVDLSKDGPMQRIFGRKGK